MRDTPASVVSEENVDVVREASRVLMPVAEQVVSQSPLKGWELVKQGMRLSASTPLTNALVKEIDQEVVRVPGRLVQQMVSEMQIPSMIGYDVQEKLKTLRGTARREMVWGLQDRVGSEMIDTLHGAFDGKLLMNALTAKMEGL